ncbi:dTDP-glucose 4,6-dehydratase [Cytobacillus sp. Hm23]
MNILVTGGAGFIGGNFVHYMVNNYPKYNIYNLDLLGYAGELTKHKDIINKDNYHFIKADIGDRKKIISLFKELKFHYVVHFAAESHVDRSIIEPDIFVRSNVLGTQVLLDAAKETLVKKFVHISTDEVYGELDFHTKSLFTEETPLQPNSPYSASKASSDFLVRAYHQTYGLPVNITRCSNNYGPYQFPEKLIPLTICKALSNEKIPVFGDGKNIRDWLHVYDHCSAIDIVLHTGVIGEVYNIGGHNEKTNLEVVQKIIKSLNKSESLIEFVTDRLGHDKRYAINSTKICNLGWSPLYNFDLGLEQTVQWYLNNTEWWERITKNNQS